MIKQIIDNTLENETFLNAFHKLNKNGILIDIFNGCDNDELKGIIKNNIETLNDYEINELLKFSFLLLSYNKTNLISENEIEEFDNYKNLSYIIGIYVYNYQKLNGIHISDILVRIFIELSIFKSKDKLFSDSEEEIELGFLPKIESYKTELLNTINLKINNKDNFFQLTFFQEKIFESLLSSKSLNISAPTSSGKTFITKLYILHLFNELSKCNVIFIVPSKALINEQNNFFHTKSKELGIKDINIFTNFSELDFSNYNSDSKNLFIFTQERLFYFLNLLKIKGENINFDLIVVDEAQKIGYGNRGILLNYILKEFIEYNNEIQVVLLSPLLKTIKKIRENYEIEDLNITDFYSNFSPVFINKIYINNYSKDKSTYFTTNNILTKEEIDLFQVEKQGLNYSQGYIDKLNDIINYINDNNPSIIYRSTPSEVIKTAHKLYESTNNIDKNSILYDFIGNIKKTIGKDYLLIDFLKKGIAFHHGRLPLNIRIKIEELFILKEIKYLVATKTLLDGINLPAKNLFISEDVNSKKWGLSKNDVDNLFGRVGRLGEYYTGNIFIVNENKIDDLIESTEEPIPNDSSVKTILNTKIDKFILYLHTNIEDFIDISENDNKEFEYLVGFLLHKRNKLGEARFLHFLKNNFNKITEENINNIILFFNNILLEIEKYDDRLINVIYSNIFVDVRKQIFLIEKYSNNEIGNIKLNKPNSSLFYEQINYIFDIIKPIYFQKFKNRKGEYYYPLYDKKIIYIFVSWVSEKLLKNINYNYYYKYGKKVKGKKKENFTEVVTKVSDNINSKVQFLYLNYLKNFIEIVNTIEGDKFLDEKIFNYIELGCYTNLSIFLITKGFNRESALVLKEILYREYKVPLYGELGEIEKIIVNKKEEILFFLKTHKKYKYISKDFNLLI